MNDTPRKTRRQFLEMSAPALAGATLSTSAARAARGETTTADQSPELPWAEQRKYIQRKWLELLGDFPKDIPDLRIEMKEVEKKEGITRYHVSFQAEEDDRVTGWLLVPDAARKKPTPAIICLHSTTWGSGKDQVIGLSGKRPVDPPPAAQAGRHYGLTHAQHGFVTLSIDALTDGERIEPKRRVMDTRGFYLKHPEWSIVGKMIWDCMRSVDFLQTLDFVAPDQIGVTGLSMGGHYALFAAAFEPRIAAAVPNGGVLNWHRHTTHWSRQPTNNNWRPWEQGVDKPTNSPRLEKRFGFKTNSGPYIYIKKFRPYIDDPALPLAVNFGDLMALVAPRPMLVISTEQEFYRHHFFENAPRAMEIYANWRDTDELPSVLAARQARLGYAETLDYYETQHNIKPTTIAQQFSKFGAGDCFSWFSFPGGHGLPGVARRMSFAWFDRWLGRTLY